MPSHSRLDTKLSQRKSVRLTPKEVAQLKAIRGMRRRTSFPYYSKVKFSAERIAAQTGYVWALPKGEEVRAFSYGRGKGMESAGFLQSDGVATFADTNLTVGNQTTSGQNVLIHGIACQVLDAGLHKRTDDQSPIVRMIDKRFLAAIAEAVSWTFSLNGDENQFRLGTLPMIPGAGGLSGGAEDITGRNVQAGQKSLPFAQNGWPTRGNYFQMPEGFIWKKQSSVDSQLNIRGMVERPIILQSGGSPENATDDTPYDNDPAAVATAEGLYNYPETLVCELMFFLIGEVVALRTNVA